MKIYFFRFLGSALLATLVTACGGGGSANNEGTLPEPVKPPSVTSTVEGYAMMGVLSNAVVEVYAIEGGEVGETPLASTTTDNEGYYSTQFASSDSQPFAVKVSGQSGHTSPTLKTCDAVSGCGEYQLTSSEDLNNNYEVDFGERYIVSDDFEMWAFSPRTVSGETNTIHVTPFTHIAAELSRTFPEGIIAEGIELANLRASIITGFDIDILHEQPWDVTNNQLPDTLERNSYIYGLMCSSLSQPPSSYLPVIHNPGEALTRITESFLYYKGQIPYRYYEVFLTQENLFSGSLEILATNPIDHTLYHDTFLRLRILQNELDGFEPGELTDAGDNEWLKLSKIEQAKKTINNLREWIYLLKNDLQEPEAIIASEKAMAEELVTPATQSMFLDLEIIKPVIETVNEQQIPSPVDLSLLDIDGFEGVTGTMEYDKSLGTFRMNALNNGNQIKIQGRFNWSEVNSFGDIAFIGGVYNQTHNLEITKGTGTLRRHVNENWRWTDIDENSELYLMIKLAEIPESDSDITVNFEGELDIDFEYSKSTYHNSYYGDSTSVSKDGALFFNGRVENRIGDGFSFRLNTRIEHDSTNGTELDRLNLVFERNVYPLEPIYLSIDYSPYSGDIDMSVSYASKKYRLEYEPEYNNSRLTIRLEHYDMDLSLTQQSDGSMSGYVGNYYDNIGSIQDRNGTVVVSYPDGSFESLY